LRSKGRPARPNICPLTISMWCTRPSIGPGTPPGRQAAGHRGKVVLQPGGKRAQPRQVVGVELRALLQDRFRPRVLVLGQAVGMTGEPAGHLPDRWRRRAADAAPAASRGAQARSRPGAPQHMVAWRHGYGQGYLAAVAFRKGRAQLDGGGSRSTATQEGWRDDRRRHRTGGSSAAVRRRGGDPLFKEAPVPYRPLGSSSQFVEVTVGDPLNVRLLPSAG
jgi:hypothetical protein